MLVGTGLHLLCLWLQTVGLVSPARAFCAAVPIASSTHIQYAIGTSVEAERVWLARLTCLSEKSKTLQWSRRR